MTETMYQPPRSNPFSTRFTRPGAIPYLFPHGTTAETLLSRLAEQCWRAQIIGPHGSGKSTLLATLEERLVERLGGIWKATLHDGQRRMPRNWTRLAKSSRAKLIIVDGYEQLTAAQRWTLALTCWWHRWGLLITAHCDVGLPTLLQTSPAACELSSVVSYLLRNEKSALPERQVLAAFESTGGDIREALFRLYDAWATLDHSPSR